ncbi:MAG: class I adenylate-forming enzyme family protein [Halolamina sp.]
MARLGFDAGTIEQVDGVTAHDFATFPDVERVEYDGVTVRAYADRPPSVATLFDEAVDRAPDRTFLVFPERECEFTYGEFADRVEGTAAALAARGLADGGRVALALSNRPAFLDLLLACFRIGAVIVPVNTHLSAEELAPLLSDASPDLVVTEGEVSEKLRAGVDASGHETTVVDVDETPEAFDVNGTMDALPAARPAETDTAALLFTSGTTGRPKGCRADNFHLCNGALNNARSFDFDDGTRSLVTTPLFHVAGLVSGALSVLPVAGSIVVRDQFSPTDFLATIEQHAVNYVMGVPTNYILAVEKAEPSVYDTSSLEVAAYGSAPMPSELVSSIREAFPGAALTNTYGKTETVSGIASMCPDEYTDARTDSVGLPTPLVEYRVVDEDRNTLPPGEVGELAVRGGIVVNEYVDRPDATAAEFANGWHLTGDIGVIDEEGFITLRGRDSDTIIRGGKNVHTLEVEEVLAAHSGVMEASVTGFPDEVLGERVLAAVVPKPDTRLTEDSLRAVCAERLAVYKQPELYRVLDELPRNASGKVEKDELLPEPLRFGIRAGE